ncbi:MAG: hypothetical protein M0D55_06285 [Elusimicrobiota bacterium]|nr:MAG: hypothetical protein M0D55_06285 [Elusimicrobiota bacterium]
MSGRAPTEREADALLGDWLDEKGIPRGSPRAAGVRAALLPARAASDADVAAKLNPKLRRFSSILIRIAAEHKMTVAAVEAVLVKRGLLEYVDDIPTSRFEHQVELALRSDELARAVENYPDNAQGETMRSVATAMSARGGKSVEEVARDGVFLYADFYGASAGAPSGLVATRDPDIQAPMVAFYLKHEGGRWIIGVYRQNKRAPQRSDAAYVDALKAWLIKGGIPARDLR